MYVGISMSVLSRVDFGTNVYTRDWDVLIVLDTARVDAMEEVAPEFDFIESVDSIRSVGSTSSEWIAKTFDTRYQNDIANTALLSANPHVQHTLYDRQFPEDDKDAYFSLTSWDTAFPEDFQYIEQPWQYATNEQYDHVLPEDLTDRAVSLYREQEPDRMVVHYMQPHRPHIANAYEEGRDLTDAERDPFTYLKNGGDRDTVFTNHVSDLEFVLRTGVEPLLRNIDAETVAITADHGDGFGENWCYAHIAGDPRQQVRRVPWIETEAIDHGELDPELNPPETAETSTEDRLEALGYI
ncbi:hypothetical protein HT576_10760 [Haloterrigena sp. SYSU A121-1]|uniref:Sulfatase N-terminal domain-containing protein n=1 Tax=Haloterrigena gelatinilytica TaxID=2741724 RepID=A0A8J8KBM8_9EURY|nr:sulfatase-like hydrolase/transferase [Haloterrigena gelatinilytica]NUB91495.1 hypothetical protein [Haloterrigena gelatinilytica]